MSTPTDPDDRAPAAPAPEPAEPAPAEPADPADPGRGEPRRGAAGDLHSLSVFQAVEPPAAGPAPGPAPPLPQPPGTVRLRLAEPPGGGLAPVIPLSRAARATRTSRWEHPG